jgi:hypothetical protein
MPRHETVRPMSDGQRADIIAMLVQSLPPLSFVDAANITSKKGDVIADLRSVYGKYSLEWATNQRLVGWYGFYKSQFGLDLNFAKIRIPEQREDFDRLIVVAQGVTIQQVYDRCKELFGAWKYTAASLDEAVIVNDRDASKGNYAVWVRDRVEADEEHNYRSVKQLKIAEVKGGTLLERLLHELKYYRETGKHLDIENITLCSGSRHLCGDVPSVGWSGDGLSVDWYGVGFAGGTLRSREVVS